MYLQLMYLEYQILIKTTIEVEASFTFRVQHSSHVSFMQIWTNCSCVILQLLQVFSLVLSLTILGPIDPF